MAPFFRWAIAAAIVGGIAGWVITTPNQPSADTLAAIEAAEANADRGQLVFWAAGCASCHTAPKAEPSERPVLSGGQAFATEFGTFYAPNISTAEAAGIGDWNLPTFATAVLSGVTPAGTHYFPAFPYSGYQNMTPVDVADLYAFMQTLPADETASLNHDVGFPFNIRRSVGGWKWLFMSDSYVVEDVATAELERGRYLVEALSHCGECHTPRNALGGLDRSKWLAGAPNPNGQGRIPGIRPEQLDWSSEEIFDYLTTGFTPDFDSAGGHMTEVVSNMARLPETDVRSIVAYLKALP